jgi:plasmid stability protein
MKNVTITLDEKTAAWARVYAAKHNTSVSRIVGEMLRQRMTEFREYDDAMRRFLGKAPVKLKRAGERYATRDELHDRAGLR